MAVTLDLDNTFGAFLIGVVVSAVLFGVTCLQTFYYFQNYGSDKLRVKLFVSMLLASETLHSALGTYSVYYYTIISYNDPVALLDSNWSVSAELAQSSVAVFAVHIFYTRRIYYMSNKNVPLVAVIFVLVLVHFGMHILVTVKGFQLHYFKFSPQIAPYLSAAVLLAAATDITIAASLSLYLHRNRCGVQNTDTMINRLIVHAVGNGILTSVFDVLVVVFAMAYPRNMIYIALYQVLSNLYTNSVLATLNSRRSMNRAGEITRISFGMLARSTLETSTLEDPGSTKPGVHHAELGDVERDITSEGTTSRAEYHPKIPIFNG